MMDCAIFCVGIKETFLGEQEPEPADSKPSDTYVFVFLEHKLVLVQPCRLNQLLGIRCG